MDPSSTAGPKNTRPKFSLAFLFVVGCCLVLARCFCNLDKSLPESPLPVSRSDPIVDIWINKMLGYFLVFLPDHTARLYQSYSFELEGVGQWQRVEDREIYPESPKIRLPSYKVGFENQRVMDLFLYSIAHHDSIVVEDRMIGHRGYNRLSDVDDPDGFYRRKFTWGLHQELWAVNHYWNAYHGRPSH